MSKKSKRFPPEFRDRVLLQPMRDGAEVVRDYKRQKTGILTVAGLMLVRQRPGSAESMVFMTLEDKTANINVIIWPDLFDANQRVVLGRQILVVKGMLQKKGDVVHLVGKKIMDLSGTDPCKTSA
ncbi:hypothetical protein AD947_14765 [Acetobacter tropicalis]|uniref:OB domain-containing protein n=1 Tax=Acetobacter tropicalis TaxID=104102 RepID=A0A149TRD0_9PROT|nr:OB-fold nucleic acid binding domain-containing protein [Acetobacter tropicalis]KXV55729.1 hypothetical protein AD947_14765 [Acetobacter tropicalis]